MIRLDAATVLLQWATGGLLFLWVTGRRREVGVGYGWLLRGTYLTIAAGALAAGQLLDPVRVRDACAAGVVVASAVALALSVVRRRAGVSGERARRQRRTERVAAMLEPDTRRPLEVAAALPLDPAAVGVREFPPNLDLVAPTIGAAGLVAAGIAAGGPDALAVARTLTGAVFLGAVTDAMLLGHWYLVQPGLGRQPLVALNRWLALVWPLEVGLLIWPTGMGSVFSGAIDDGYGGVLAWFWAACAVATLVLAFVTTAALRERGYAAVMAATGLLYLAILTAFGTDLVARAVLAS